MNQIIGQNIIPVENLLSHMIGNNVNIMGSNMNLNGITYEMPINMINYMNSFDNNSITSMLSYAQMIDKNMYNNDYNHLNNLLINSLDIVGIGAPQETSNKLLALKLKMYMNKCKSMGNNTEECIHNIAKILLHFLDGKLKSLPYINYLKNVLTPVNTNLTHLESH